jgi:predicted Rossmann fold flavoprotein
MSRKLAVRYSPGREGMELRIDMFPGLERHHLDQKLIAWFGEHPRKQIPTLLSEFVPRAVSDQFCRAADCVNITGSQLPKSKRDALLDQMKSLTVHVTSTRPIREATVTRGGVDTSQIEPTTMESRICPGLFFAGEVMNVDGPCGGYNLTIAFATGALAGMSSSKNLKPALNSKF